MKVEDVEGGDDRMVMAVEVMVVVRLITVAIFFHVILIFCHEKKR